MNHAPLVDNDVIIKLARYRLLTSPFLDKICTDVPPSVLSAARYVVSSRVKKATTGDAAAEALAELEAFFAKSTPLEPTQEELQFALQLEDVAYATGLALDVGESQLIAIAVRRGGSKVLTGDKRAIQATEQISSGHAQRKSFEQLFVCFEQVMLELLRHRGLDHCRTRVCSDAAADRAVAMAFACHSEPELPEVVGGLHSYIDFLRLSCPTVLSAT